MSDVSEGPAPLPPIDEPLLELRVEPEAVPMRRRAWGAVLAIAAVAVAITQPWFFASVALPLLFAWLGYRVVIARERPYTLRLGDEGLEILTPGCRDLVGWSHVESVAPGPGTFTTLRFAGGGAVQIPARALHDRAVLLGALPASVRVEPPPEERSPAAKKHDARKTVILWIVLVVLLYAVYQLVETAP